MENSNLYKEEIEVTYLERDKTSRYKELYEKKKFTLKTLRGVLARIERENLKVISIVWLRRNRYDRNEVEVIERYDVGELLGDKVEYGLEHGSGKFILK